MLFVPMDDVGAARGRALYMLFIFLLFMVFSPNPPNPYRLLALEALADRERHALDILQNATFTGPIEIPSGLNLTGVLILFDQDLILGEFLCSRLCSGDG
jgi:hypothetical protein